MRTVVPFLAALAFVPGAFAKEIAPLPPKSIDLVLCLDTSNSMDGLIDAAKRKLWVIVNDLAKIEPAPKFRVALYSYGNDNYAADKGWVRKDLDLTTDLDEVYRKLNALTTRGGTELVARVSRDALKDLQWTPGGDTLRIMFVCGNEPANQDREVQLSQVALDAKERGVIVNTIYCGTANNREARGWEAFAQQCGGKYAHIDQNKGEVAIATPFDAELQKLGDKVNSTCVWCGDKGKAAAANQVAQDANAAKLSPSAATERGVTKAGRLYKNAEADLVDRLSEKDFDLKKVKDEDLPEEMKKLKPEDRLEHLKKKAAERAEIQKKVAELAKKREQFIEAEKKKQPKDAAEKALDDALKAMLREQAATKGMTIKG